MLVPYAIPAYFLSTYSGPTSALAMQFEQSLLGLGVGEWRRSSDVMTPPFPGGEADSVLGDDSATSFVLVWVNIENKQGEDKGITVIWPARLCLSFLPSSTSTHARTPLPYLPQLPSQLQPSPKLPSTSIHHVVNEQTSLTKGPTSTSDSTRRRRPCRSPTSDSLRALRLLTLSLSKDIKKVAFEVGGYVDAVAKEREKERERIRREREMANNSASPRIVSNSNAPLPGPSHSVVTPGPTPVAIRSEPAEGQNIAATPIPVTPTHVQQAQAPVTSIQPFSNRNFYPSPPQSNVPHPDVIDVTQTSPDVTMAPLPDVQNSEGHAPETTHALPASTPAPFDPFASITAPTWSQPSAGEFMDMDMDFGMGGFDDLGMDPIAGSGGVGAGADSIYDRDGVEPEDAFTDDDFNFFDRPARPAPIRTVNSANMNLTESVPLSFTSPLFGAGPHSAGLGPPTFATTPVNLLSPWVPGALGDVFTPKFTEVDQAHTEPFTASPSQAPRSRSAPSSPVVQLSYDHSRNDNSRPSSSRGPSVFDPIPFALSHRVSDGKYSVGKFALPSPPDEEDRTEAVLSLPASPLRSSGWRFKYNIATDPRIGVVRKLKRKSVDQGGRECVKRYWQREYDDSPSFKMECDPSEAESDDEMKENDSPVLSRPSTPTPAYLPQGPMLLYTRFQHSLLLPLTTPLRHPGAVVAPTSITSPPAAISVPTPVSPAALIGAASEKSKSLEAAAQAVAREVVENVVWGNAWRANISGSSSLKQRFDIWPADILVVKQLLDEMPGLENALSLAALLGESTYSYIVPSNRPKTILSESPESLNDGDQDKLLRPMDSPAISVAKADVVIQLLPTALRFWEKLGLGPRGGKKNVTAFILFEGEETERLQQAEKWLATMSAVYAVSRTG